VALVIFDCDGVLVDTELLAAEVEAELLQAQGAAITAADVIARYAGLSDPELRRRVESDFDIGLSDDFTERKTARLNTVFDASLRAVEGMPDLVAGLVRPTCVASSSSLPRIHRCLELTGLLTYFEPNVFSASMVAHGKPAPDLFLHAASQMRTAPARTLVIEDTAFGVAGGVAAGMTVIGFTGGAHCTPETKDALRRAGASDVVSDAAELGELLAAG
jgi:HAD superfamily hydrolase (TIGR01509 family)